MKAKEILDMLKDSHYIPSDDNRTYKLLDKDDTRHLLDYITNLQTIEQQYSAILSENAELENKITNLQEDYDRIYNENCKLREKHNIDDISLLDENYNLQKENERLNEIVCKSRYEKAMKILQGIEQKFLSLYKKN